MSQIHYKARLRPNPPSAGYITPSSAVRASQQGGSFLINTNLTSPFPSTKVCSIFSNWVLPPSSGGQPRATAIGPIVFRLPGHP